MADQFDTSRILYPPNAILEIKKSYLIPRDKSDIDREKQYIRKLKEDNLLLIQKKKIPKLITKKKFEATFYYQGESSPSDKTISVRELVTAIEEKILKGGFLRIQSMETYWSSLRIKCLNIPEYQSQPIVVPLTGCFGLAIGEAPANSAFVFDLFEKYNTNTRRFHIRGVSSIAERYGSDVVDTSVTQAVKDIESFFLDKMVLLKSDRIVKETTEGNINIPSIVLRTKRAEAEVPTGSILLQPGRLVNKKKRNRVFELITLSVEA